MALVVFPVQSERLATGCPVQRVIEEKQVRSVHSALKETVSPAPWVHLVCRDFQGNLALRAWACLGQRGTSDSEACPAHRDLQVKASQDLWVTPVGLDLRGPLGRQDKEFKDPRANRGRGA